MDHKEEMNRLAELEARFKTEPGHAVFPGMRIDNLTKASATVVVPISPQILIPEGAVQGGFIVAAADFAGVYNSMAQIAKGHTFLSSAYARFLRPLTLADRHMQALATLTEETRSRILVEVIVRGASDGKVKARLLMEFAKPEEVK